MDRRTLLSAAAALPLAGPAQAAVDYVVLLGNGKGAFTELADGFRLKGGAYNDPTSGVRMFSRFTLPSTGTLRFKLTRELIPSIVTSNGVWFNVGIVWGRDPATLPTSEPTGDLYTSSKWDGWRITMANKAAKSTTSNRLRMSVWPSRTQLNPREAKVIADFKLNVTAEVVLTWDARVVKISTLGKSQSWDHEEMRVPTDGARLMWYGSPGGKWRVNDIRLP